MVVLSAPAKAAIFRSRPERNLSIALTVRRLLARNLNTAETMRKEAWPAVGWGDAVRWSLGSLCLALRRRLPPKLLRNFEGIDAHVVPPRSLITGVVKLAMVGATKGNGELVPNLPRHCAGLSEADMVRV